MAQRRMFSKTITNSSRFLMMPQSSQNLYFHLGMNADDDGFCEHFSIMRMTESKPDDLKVLQAKEFVKVFDDKVLIIKEWKENNYIQKDRYTPSKYLQIYKKELAQLSHISEMDTKCIQDVSNLDTQVRLGKVRKEENAPAKPVPFVLSEELGKLKTDKKRHIQLIGEYLEEKKIPLHSKDEIQEAIKRHTRAAVSLSKFTDDRIGWATGKAEKDYPEYTLETLIKILTR